MASTMPEMAGVTHRDVNVNGVRIHVAEAGSGPPIVLQHGWPQHWWSWRRVIGPLAAEHRVICPDLRGFGWSAAPADGYDKEQLADDLLGVLDALGLERVRLVGHDWGGFAGFLACLRAPERFSGFLALSILHPWPVTNARRALDPRQLARMSYQFVLASPILGRTLLGHDSVVREFLARAGGGAWDEQTLRSYTERLARPEAARASTALYRTFLTRELAPLLRGRYADRRLTVPTRMLVGDRDPVITRDALSGFEAHAPELSLDWLPGVDHWVPERCPERVLEEIALLP